MTLAANFGNATLALVACRGTSVPPALTKVRTMTRDDFLSPLLTLHPLGVALVIWGTGWGSLLLIAWGTDMGAADFLRHPGYMVGDFFVLPLAGLLIAHFYRSASGALPAGVGGRVTVLAVSIATLSTVAATLFSVFISEHYHGAWSVPHTIFIWFIAYVLAGFFIRGGLRLLSTKTRGSTSLTPAYSSP